MPEGKKIVESLNDMSVSLPPEMKCRDGQKSMSLESYVFNLLSMSEAVFYLFSLLAGRKENSSRFNVGKSMSQKSFSLKSKSEAVFYLISHLAGRKENSRKFKN